MTNYEQLVASITASAIKIVDAEHDRDPERLRRRDQHAKHHGCVWAYLDVLTSLPQRLQVGIFKPGERYHAWVRFSNSNPRVQRDTEFDGRGLAIKLLLEDTEHPGNPAGTQDFILLNHSAFFARDLEEMESIFRWQASGKLLPLYFLRFLKVRGAWAIYKLATRPRSVLDLTYYTQLPSAFGDAQEVKYRLRPIGGIDPVQPTKVEKASRDHLRHVLRRQLRPNQYDRANALSGREPGPDQPNGDVLFALEVQFKRKDDDLEIANVSWRGGFEQVAVLRIPRQDFEQPERMAFAENMAFNPWNSLPEHEPRGWLSRARRDVYRAVADYRLLQNNRQEPAYTLEKWRELRALPSAPGAVGDVQLKDVIASLSPAYWRWLEKLFAWRFAPFAFPAAVLIPALYCVFHFPEYVGRPVLIDAPLRALGLKMKSEDLIPKAVPSPRYAQYLATREQGYRPEDDVNQPRWQFRHGQMGAEFHAGIPYWIFRVLPEVAPDHIKDWSDFGLVKNEDKDKDDDEDDDYEYYTNYHDLPRGVAMSDSIITIGNMDYAFKLKRVALNCASCHRGEVRINNKTKLIDGMPNLTFDAASYKRKLSAAIASKAFTTDNVVEKINAVLAKDHAAHGRAGKPHRLGMFERIVYGYIVDKMKRDATDKEAKLGWMARRPENGPGRLDAFGAFRYEVLGLPDAPKDRRQEDLLVATVDLPSVWHQGREYRPRHHYDGNTEDARARNIGAIIGVGGHPLSVRFRSVQRVVDWLDHELAAPRFPWPDKLKSDAAQRGKGIYEEKCKGCHGTYDAQSQLHEPTDCMKRAIPNLTDTDSYRRRAVDNDLVKDLNNYGEKQGIWGQGSFEATGAYLCPPLDGIWARAPYLHNGSVPTLDQLLSGQRGGTFVRGNPEYDIDNGGFRSQKEGARLPFDFDTSKPGNSDRGHSDDEQLVRDKAQRQDLIQYLYTL